MNLNSLVHDLANLLGVDEAEAAAEDGEVLAEDEDGAAEDAPAARHHAVPGRAAIAIAIEMN